MTKHDIAGSGIDPIRIGVGSANQKIGESISIDVSPGNHAAVIACSFAADLKAVGAIQACKIETRRKTRWLPEHDIRGSRSRAVRIGGGRTHNEICESIAADVSGTDT